MRPMSPASLPRPERSPAASAGSCTSSPRGRQDVAEVEIAGAVEAPYFVLGKTRNWKTVRERPAPWAEFATSKVVITVPSDVIRKLDDPAALMRFWDEVMDACADLAARPHERESPERYVADVQISVGYMHAGYPIMTHLDAAPRFVDAATLRKQGDWGMFHEMGHNHQHRDWTFGGTTEVTCNLFTLYVMETVCGVERPRDNDAAQVRRYRAGGRKFTQWKRQPFLALAMYRELRDAFGWDAYKQVFAEYRDLKPPARPKTDAEKRDQWMVRFSKTVGKNLGPFFQWWGVPVSSAARKQITNLPAWMPKRSDR